MPRVAQTDYLLEPAATQLLRMAAQHWPEQGVEFTLVDDAGGKNLRSNLLNGLPPDPDSRALALLRLKQSRRKVEAA